MDCHDFASAKSRNDGKRALSARNDDFSSRILGIAVLLVGLLAKFRVEQESAVALNFAKSPLWIPKAESPLEKVDSRALISLPLWKPWYLAQSLALQALWILVAHCLTHRFGLGLWSHTFGLDFQNLLGFWRCLCLWLDCQKSRCLVRW